MRYQKQPNRWSCFPTAVAIVLGIEVDEIFKQLGHNGSEVCWPELDEPFCRRSFHQQEMVNVCFENGCGMISVSQKLAIAPLGTDDLLYFENPMFGRYVKYYNGVFTGRTQRNQPHALASYGGDIIDPSTGMKTLDKLIIDQFHIIHKLDYR